MANNNNEGADNNPDNTKDAGLDKSFVGKFVSGIFNSTPLSKWFGKDSSSSSKSSVRRREEEDDDDDEFNGFSTFQPPSKRAKLPTDVEHNSYSAYVFESPVTVHNSSNNVNNVSSKVSRKFPEPLAGPSGVKSRKLFEKHDTASTNTLSTNSFENQVDVINGDNDSDSEISTSGYSSAPKLVNKLTNDEVSTGKESCEKITPKSRSLFTSTHNPSGNRSLFTEKSPHMNTSLSSRRPAFNASTFGSPNFVDRTLSTKRILSSPFYSGHTIYGGASAYGRRFGLNSEESNSLTRTSVQAKPVNEKSSSENAMLSKTARRILSTLEQYSTPISDAKKIPVTPRKPGLLSTYVGATPYLVRDRKKASAKELQVPSVPDLLQMKQKERLQNTTETVRQIATKSKSDLNKEEYKIRTEEDNRQKHSNKMKSSIASVRLKAHVSDEPVNEVKLPKVSLPITTLPKFDFVLMPPSSTSNTVTETSKSATESSQKSVVTKAPISTINKPTVIMDKKETEKKIENGKTSSYTFSEPLIISNEMKSVAPINCFKFSEPLNKKQPNIASKPSENHTKTDSPKIKNNGENVYFVGTKISPQMLSGNVIDVLGKKKQMTSSQESKWECPTCLVRNDSLQIQCLACREPKPELDKQDNKGFGEQFKLTSDKWECGSCMVRNNNTDKTCVACSSAKPNDKPSVVSGFGDKFKPPASTWECSSCLIRNKNELENCAACGTAKTGQGATVSSFGDKFKPSSDTWECSVCMIRNKNDLVKCAACETPKPGTKNPTVQKTVTFNEKPTIFGGANNAKLDQKPMFSFGIKPTQWECKTCMIKNNNDLKKCAACEMPKDDREGFGDAFKMKADEWECTSCMVKNKSTADTCVCCGVVKPGTSSEKLAAISKSEEKKPVNSFNFGIDKSSATQFKFGIPATKNEPKESSAVSSTPSIFSSGDITKTSTVTSSTFTFGIKPVENVPSTKPAVVSSSTESSTTSLITNPLLKRDEKLPEKQTPAPAGFKFGLDNKTNKTSSEDVVSSSSNKTETTASGGLSTSFGTKSATPMFQFKPPAINGDINKPKDNLFAKETIKPNTTIFGNDLNKPKESMFGADLNKSQESPFAMNKSATSPFTKVNKPSDSPFGNLPKNDSPFSNISKSVESPFGNVNKTTESPFANTNKQASSSFGNVSKPSDSLFGNTPEVKKPKESLFSSSSNPTKTQEIVFGKVNEASKPQESIFAADANKPKESLFGSKPSESKNVFATPTTTPSFSFTPKPAETTMPPFPSASSSVTTAPGIIFKFGADSSQNTIKKFGESSDNNISNGFGSVPKMPAFATPQSFGTPENKPFNSTDKPFGSTESKPFGTAESKPFGTAESKPFGVTDNKPFGSTENKPFSFGASDAAPKSAGFSFGQPDKPNTAAPAVFSFGSSAAAAASTNTPNTGFNFSVPSSGFNFGSAAKVENSPFNAPNNIFGSAGTGAKNGSFNFGPNANNNNQKAVFTFGANQTSQPLQQTQSSFPTPNQPTFNFGSQSQPVNVPGSFNFTGPNPTFNLTDGNSVAAPRKIKRAVRRTTQR